MRKSSHLMRLLFSASLCVYVSVHSQEITDTSLDTIQDTVPHCGTVKDLGPLCYQSRSVAQRKAIRESVVLKAIEMLEENKKKVEKENSGK